MFYKKSIQQCAELSRAEPMLALQKIFKKQGLNFHLNTKVTDCKTDKKQVVLKLESNGKTDSLEADKVLVAIGRVPNTENLNLLQKT